jgi:hypothetical protein
MATLLKVLINCADYQIGGGCRVKVTGTEASLRSTKGGDRVYCISALVHAIVCMAPQRREKIGNHGT